MAKEKVKHLSGVFASVFAHHGHITKEEAQEISGLDSPFLNCQHQDAKRSKQVFRLLDQSPFDLPVYGLLIAC